MSLYVVLSLFPFIRVFVLRADQRQFWDNEDAVEIGYSLEQYHFGYTERNCPHLEIPRPRDDTDLLAWRGREASPYMRLGVIWPTDFQFYYLPYAINPRTGQPEGQVKRGFFDRLPLATFPAAAMQNESYWADIAQRCVNLAQVDEHSFTY